MPSGNATYYFSADTGQNDLYVHPLAHPSTSLATWDTLKRLATELAAPNLGLYSVSLDQAYPVHRVFKGATVPSSWNDHIDELIIEFTSHDELLTAIEDVEDAVDAIQGSGAVTALSVPAALINAGYDPTMIVVFRGTTWSFIISDVIIPEYLTDLWFTLRKRNSDDEEESIVQISRINGLLISNGAVAIDPSLGSLVVTSDSGLVPVYTVTITVHSSETQYYPCSKSLIYDLKTKTSDDPSINTIIHQSTNFQIKPDITRKI